MIETLYLFLLCLMIYLFWLFIRRPANWLAAALGGAAGLAVLARPPALFLVPVFLYHFWRAKRWRSAVLLVVVLLAIFIPWTWRNWQVYGEPMPFGAAGNFNFWIGNYHGGNGEQSPTEEHIQFAAKYGVREINSESLRQFKIFLRDYPAEFLKLTLLRVNKYFSIFRPMGFWFYLRGPGQFLFILSSAVTSVLVFILALAGILKIVATRDKRLYYLLALTVMTPLIVFITVVETRYRFPIYPLLAIFAAYFIVSLGSRFKWRSEKLLWLAVALIFLNGAVDLFLNIGLIKERLNGFF
ncbi:MAG: Conserved membrane protein [Parcubacteria group bacterium GW2011_GWA2_43_9b]|nr:MAG: Conserved membrane protein [Parcubacteria group bacterium GW2011_GWA2_43_9b]